MNQTNSLLKAIGTVCNGRCLTDLFYLPGATDPANVLRNGLFLNLELIDRWRESISGA